ncbi:resolvase [Mycolicibacterium litorale]|nr:resolvase [Mycolicibacterium litorale]
MPEAWKPAVSGQLLGYARVSTAHQSNDAQVDDIEAAGVDPDRIYVDKLTGASRREDRPGLAALLDYARPGDVIVVKGVDRLGRDAAEVMLTIRDLLTRDIVIRALREGVDSSTPTGRAVLGIMASLAELELELGRERREAARASRKARGLPTGRPRALTPAQVEQVVKLAAAGESVSAIAESFRVGRDTVYRVLKAAEEAGDG